MAPPTLAPPPVAPAPMVVVSGRKTKRVNRYNPFTSFVAVTQECVLRLGKNGCRSGAFAGMTTASHSRCHS
jgi:hypothetical protein